MSLMRSNVPVCAPTIAVAIAPVVIPATKAYAIVCALRIVVLPTFPPNACVTRRLVSLTVALIAAVAALAIRYATQQMMFVTAFVPTTAADCHQATVLSVIRKNANTCAKVVWKKIV
jgi:hypothetical protein